MRRKLKDDIRTTIRIYRGIVARWKADGPKEQVGVNKNNKLPEIECTGEHKIIFDDNSAGTDSYSVRMVNNVS